MNALRFFSKAMSRNAAVSGAAGHRAYAVGDVHGCLDLLQELLLQIQEDNASRPQVPAVIVFLGDLIDRGPDSRGVVDFLRTLKLEGLSTVHLVGNHEEVLLRLLRGERGLLSSWLKFGGDAFVTSYGLPPETLAMMGEEEAVERLRSSIPTDHVEFIEGFSDTFRFGDYLFVHAGIRPGVELGMQSATDLRWIRDPFLNDDSTHDFLVIHGHTITRKVDERSNRIGIDTGAYRTGVLSALGIEGTDRWLLETSRHKHKVSRHRGGS